MPGRVFPTVDDLVGIGLPDSETTPRIDRGQNVQAMLEMLAGAFEGYPTLRTGGIKRIRLGLGVDGVMFSPAL